MREWHPGPAWIFCPADRPDRYGKALSSADIVILDLEDAVPAANKEAARSSVRQLRSHGALDLERTVLRINDTTSPHHALDVDLARDAGFLRVMLSKTESPADVASLDHQVIALVETPLGVERAGDIAGVANLVAMMWGADDLVAGLGGFASRNLSGTYRDVVRYARSRVLVAAKSHGLMALDAVHMDIDDLDGLATACADALAVGFDATPAIHPSQLSRIRHAYRPPAERVDWARRLLEQVGESAGVTTFEGRMVDGPIYKQAERVLRMENKVSKSGVADE